jgi:peptidoglycan/LPS O-acetylase OafA/YrhL
VAVGLVVLNHAALGPFKGGYVGVDVFFVISGYLISGLIIEDCAQGRFSFASFYERRVRRILPALLATILATTLFAMLVMPPTELRDFIRTLPPATFFYANFHMAGLGGYFAPETDNVPLMHLWSVAVEEQFYIVFPALCLVVYRIRPAAIHAVFVVLAVASLAYASVRLASVPDRAYFGTLERVWELLLGACCRPLVGRVPEGGVWRGVAGSLGLLLILTAALTFDASTAMPGYVGLVPCVGAGLVLLGGIKGGRGLARLLETAPFVRLGRWSYSVYLWHWPLLVACSYYAPDGMSDVTRSIVLAVILAVSALSYRFIETPFRHAGGPIPFALFARLAGATVVLLTLSFLAVSLTQGFRFRQSAETQEVVAALREDLIQMRRCRSDMKDGSIVPCHAGPVAAHYDLAFFGDSHAGAIARAFTLPGQRPPQSIMIDWTPGCPPVTFVEPPPVWQNPAPHQATCKRASEIRTARFYADTETAPVVFALYWTNYLDSNFGIVSGRPSSHEWVISGVRAHVRRLAGSSRKVVLVGPVPIYRHSIGRSYERSAAGLPAVFEMPRSEFERANVDVLQALRDLEGLPGVQVIYPHEALCDRVQCHALMNGKPLYYDNNHLSRYGSAQIAPMIEAALARLAQAPSHASR